MTMNKDTLKRYILQIKGTEFTGSGVLVQSDKKFYIFTAKHNFKSTSEQEVKDIEIEDIREDIDNGDITILTPYPDTKIKDVIGLDNPAVDFIVFVLDRENSKGLNNQNIEQLKVFNDDFKECIVAGYPIIRGDNSIEYFDCFYETKVEEDEDRDDYKNTFEVSPTKQLFRGKITEMETIVGISGGGVFVQGSDNSIYLAGIEIEYKGIRNLVCISLRDIIDEVNEKLKDKFDDKIEVGGFSLYEKFGIDINKLKLDSIKNEISQKNDYIYTVLEEAKGENNEYDFFKNHQNQYFKKINKEYKNIENLAKAFLYNGIVFHENKDYNRATRHFKKAVKLDPSLEVYFAQSKFKRDKGLSPKQNEEIEKNIANISSNNEEKIIENLIESINNGQELESKILHLNHLLYRKIASLEYLGDYSIEGEYKGKEESTDIEYNPKQKEVFDETREKIIKYTKKLSNFYLDKRDFVNAQVGLKGLQFTFQKLLNDHEINKELLEIYEESQNDFFGNSCIDKKSLIDELFSFMDRFQFNSDEYRKIKEMIKNISRVDNRYAEFIEKIKKFEKDYDEKVDSLSLGLQHISKNIVDKDVLVKIDFMLENLTSSHNGLNLKINNLEKKRAEEEKAHQHILRVFKMIMEKGNKELVDSVQKISNRNSIETRLMLNQLLGRVERGLGNIEIEQDGANFIELDKNLKKIVADEIESFYTKINTTQEIIDEKNKIIRLIQRRYGEHVLSLKESIEDKKKEAIHLKIELKALNKWLDDINKKYETEKVKSEKFEIKVAELKDINRLFEESLSNSDSSTVQLVDLKKYQLEIESLNGLVLELKNSITLSSKTANTLENSVSEDRKNIKDYLDKIEQKYQEIDERKKNAVEKEFSEVLNNIHSRLDTMEYEPPDKEDFEKIFLQLEQLDTKLNNIEENYEFKIDEIEKKFAEIIPTIKNQRLYRKVIKYVKKFEKDLEEIKRSISVIKQTTHVEYDPEINLHLLQSDLEKIESIMKKRRLPIYSLYCQVRAVILSSFLILFTIFVLLNEPFSSWIKNFSF